MAEELRPIQRNAIETNGQPGETVSAPNPVVELAADEPSRFRRTFAALQHSNYRIYWGGLWGMALGWQFLYVAQSWLVYELTDSAIYLGLVGLANAVPAILFSTVGGLIADRLDRRKLMTVTQGSFAVLAFIMAILTVTNQVSVWHILGISLLTGVVTAIDNPARQALLPRLVGKKDLINAIALGSSVWQSSRVIGPSVAGLLIVAVGISTCFFITFVGYLIMVASLTRIQLDPDTREQQTDSMISKLSEGFRFVLERPLFRTIIGITFINSVFGMSYSVLMPVFAKDVLAVGATGYGFLMGAPGIGAVTGSLTLVFLGNFRYRGRFLWVASTVFGMALLIFAISPWYLFSLAILFLGGMMNSMYMTVANSSLQEFVPDGLRGRVMGIYLLTYNLIPLGGLQAGAVADRLGAPVAVAIGGLIMIVFALGFVARLPEIKKLNQAT